MKHYVECFPGREIVLNNTKYLYFGGTAYLGLQTNVAFQNIFIENLKRYGTNYGASRKSNVQLPIFKKAEEHLAKIVGAEACLTMSSGYLAGQFISQYLSTSNYRFFYAPNTHSALFQTKLEPYATFGQLADEVCEHLESKEASVPVVFLDSIDFSGNNYPNFKGLQLLPLNKVILVVDDSHGIGIVGDNGGGVYKTIKKLSPKELIVSSSLGKGFGIQAGGIFGTAHRISVLMDTPFFGGASPASPSGLATFFQSEKLYQKNRKTLKGNIKFFTDTVSDINQFTHMKNHPAFSFSDMTLTEKLEENGIIVTNFKYPNEDSTVMSRIVISAAHKKEDIQYLCRHLNTLLK
ncbi:aminotransferase class I/II-fold pyridoxal phosphate-dependent enzyme [Costertonia aggregata]|uniref:Aminotransferase class I/II-fold pyridoxal phosphate-dependent enzyme n=1 Tax=Costertonia aggregata TaxID=343403 RepID=A0A7H9AKV0_9FLAO|nr:aminotransferase class I/II-fold pyridoxal phosphate-dependent enzyme [Costertonia aggregata]QLG44037.1 aminotransferase class I/II-fold pyridoxal phosphate-dependent enzyme [Costertonia aggregata]